MFDDDKIARYPSWNVSVIFAWTKSRLKWPFQLIILPPCYNPVSSLPQRTPPYYCSSITAVISIFGIFLHFWWYTFCILYSKQINQTVIFLSFPRYCHHSKEKWLWPKNEILCLFLGQKSEWPLSLLFTHLLCPKGHIQLKNIFLKINPIWSSFLGFVGDRYELCFIVIRPLPLLPYWILPLAIHSPCTVLSPVSSDML